MWPKSGRVKTGLTGPVAPPLEWEAPVCPFRWFPLLKSQVVTGVRRALRAAGLDSTQYSGHSFRIGVATSATVAGVPDHLVKTLGRWEFSAYLLYIWTPRESLAAVSTQLAGPSASSSASSAGRGANNPYFFVLCIILPLDIIMTASNTC